MKNKIVEIFYSLQGEGFYTGTAAVFVRFAGCNLACDFCDTNHKLQKELSNEEIVAEVCKYPTNFIVLTGGEPSLQVSDELIDLLHAKGKFVTMETNGTRAVPQNLDWITCSPKEGTQVVLTKVNEVKVVYQKQDVEKWKNVIAADWYFLQPCSCKNTADVVAYIQQHPHWRLSLQTHKYIGIE